MPVAAVGVDLKMAALHGDIQSHRQSMARQR